MGWDHLASHLHEMYFVPSLAFVAMKSHGFKVEFIYRMYLAPDCARRDAPFLARSLRYYFRKHSANIIPHMEDMRVLVAEETASA